MYVGGLRAAAGGSASLVEDCSAVVVEPPRRGLLTSVRLGLRAASGAARDLEGGSVGAVDGAACAARRRPFTLGQLVGIDLIAVALAAGLALAGQLGVRGAAHGVDVAAVVLLPLLWVATAAASGAYDVRFVGVGSHEYARIGRVFTYVTVVITFVSYALRLDLGRGVVMLALPLALAMSCGGRFAARVQLRRRRRAGEAMNRVLAVGRAASAQRLAFAMSRDTNTGFEVVGACLLAEDLHDVEARRRLAHAGIAVLGGLDNIRASAGAAGASSVAVVAGDIVAEEMRSLAWSLEGSGVDLVVFPGLAEVASQRVHVQTVAGLPLLRIDEPRFTGLRRMLKGGLDRTAAAFALVLLSPLLVALAAVVRFTSAGPALYLQERIGRDGKPFRMLKFRSMCVGAHDSRTALIELNDANGGLLFKIREDPRVTRAGRVLRRYSLDELPQLFNVLTGSMSLVGPRPPLSTEVALYTDEVRRRLLVKPGLTGLWQVSGRSDLSWDESVRLDLNYVENWSLGLDLLLLAKTAGVVFKPTGAY
jgi:exopolysaccharide biosynthesis polyprenyl glycosylphosphotransferase